MKTGLTCLAYAVAIVIVAIGADRIAAAALYGADEGRALSAESYYHPTVRQKIQQVSDGAADDRSGLFIGNSLTMLGIDPASFDASLTARGIPFSSYNLAIPSVGVTFWPEFFDRYWRRDIPPDLLLGVQPRDVNARGTGLTVQFIDLFFDTANAGNSIQTWAENALSDAFTLYQRRGTLFEDGPELDIPIGSGPGSTDITVHTPQGFGVTGDPFHLTPGELRENRRAAQPVEGPPFDFDPSAAAALERLADQQAAVGGRLILYTFPVFFDSEPEGAPGVQADFVSAMHTFASDHPGVVFVDAAAKTRSEFSASDYVDENHFDPPAARRFSADLADLLAPVLGRD